MTKESPCIKCPNENSTHCQYCVKGSRNPDLDETKIVPYISFFPTFSVRRAAIQGSEDLPLLSFLAGKKK